MTRHQKCTLLAGSRQQQRRTEADLQRPQGWDLPKRPQLSVKGEKMSLKDPAENGKPNLENHHI